MTAFRGPRFSVVTVCRNAQDLIDATAASLRMQVDAEYEWVVVDGASADGTCARVLAACVPELRLTSEPDCGIYDAMNKAVRLAKGEWIYFLNAGDELSDPRVLADVAAAQDRLPDVQLLWGNVRYVWPDGKTMLRRFDHVSAAWLPFEDLNHQGVFARRDLFDQLGCFQTSFRTSADYDWLLRVLRSNIRHRHVSREIARFTTGGAHTKNPAALREERRRIRLQYCNEMQLNLGVFAARFRRRWRLWLGRGG